MELTVQTLASDAMQDATKGVKLAVSVVWGTFWTEKMVNVLRKKIVQKKVNRAFYGLQSGEASQPELSDKFITSFVLFLTRKTVVSKME